MLQFTKVSLAYGDRDILNEVSLILDQNTKSALAGANGAGKSTLLKLAAGINQADSGTISAPKGYRVGYLPQGGLEAQPGRTLWEETEEAFALFKSWEEEAHRLAEAMEAHQDPARQEQLIQEHHQMQEKVVHSGYYSREQAIGTTLRGLGFSKEDYTKEASAFSGGWQMRIALAKVLLEKPDFLLLDEPTNYLDIEARQWLQKFLSSYEGGFLLVSHDRFFLDQTVSQVVEIFQGNLKTYKGNYTQYQKIREQELNSLFAEYEKQQEELQKLDDFINRFRSNASKAKLVQSRIKQRDKIIPIQIPEGMIPIHFHFPPPPHSGKQVLTLENLHKSYGDHQVLKGVDLELLRGDKLVITGVNGAGKSTLMRILAGEDTDFTGKLKWGTDVQTGYFSQDHETKLKGTNNILEEMEENCPTSMIPNLRNLLGAFLFRGDDVFKGISVLSGGEKSRISLLKLLLSPANLLILDEPTNHLDLTSKEVLLEALREYSGTLIFVSHDHYFIENLATKVLELNPQGPRLIPGDYSYYLLQKERLLEGEPFPEPQQTPEEDNLSEGKLDHLRQKEIKRERQKWERKSAEAQEAITQVEEELQELQQSLADPEVYSDADKSRQVQKRIEESELKLEEVMLAWEEAEETLGSLVD